jgi:hypothetical protein
MTKLPPATPPASDYAYGDNPVALQRLLLLAKVFAPCSETEAISATRRDRPVSTADLPAHSRTELEYDARRADQLPIGRIVLRINRSRPHVEH